MKMGKSIRGALSYNEQKVSQGTAELILASHFSRDISEMGFSEKLLRFEKLAQLNERSKTNTLHLSLNFSPDDRLKKETLQKIAADYMERIGFGKQPFLVYQHNDTAHPHVHIVTTTIRSTGKAIYLHNIGRIKSEPARKAIEQEYGLIPAESRKLHNTPPLQPADLKAAIYGKAETKRMISNIVREVTASYKYASLDELNAILRQYRVVADPGAKGSRIRQHKGLVYSLLDKDGCKIGVPIKASTIYSNPTLFNLEKKFERNRVRKLASSDFMASAVRSTLTHSRDGSQFLQSLKQYNITCAFMRDENNAVGQVYFIDNRKKAVFTHSELSISLPVLLDRLNTRHGLRAGQADGLAINGDNREAYRSNFGVHLINDLLSTERTFDDISPEFLKKKRKKRKR